MTTPGTKANGMIVKIDHIGIVVKDLDKSLKVYTEVLGIALESVEVNDPYKVTIAFLPVGETLVELIEPTVAAGTMIADFLKTHGEGVHHIAFQVDNLDAALERLKAGGVPLIDETAKSGGRGTRVAFIHPSSSNNVAIELLEKKCLASQEKSDH